MTFQQLIALLPCHSLDDFPFHLEGREADQILSSYTALWHPSLIAHARSTPTWHRCDDEEQSWEGCLVTVPQICRDDMPGYWLDDLRGQGAVVLNCEDATQQDELVAVAVSQIADAPPKVEASIVADFLALGLCHLLTEVLTVRMRYSNLLDRERFRELLIVAADLAHTGDAAAIHQSLGKCFDALAESKDHFYPVDSFFIDLTLVAKSVLGSGLAAELSRGTPVNLVISADDVRRMHADYRETADALHRALNDGDVCLVGGEAHDETPLSISTIDSVVRSLQSGLNVYQQYLGHRPKVFGRRTFGLNCFLPQALVRCGFIGALHFSLDGSRCPESYHGAMRWQGADGTQLTALARPPLDAQQSESVLALPQHLGDAMDSDHVAAICFAHWPGQESPWYRDLQRASKFGTFLGRFVTIDEFFEQTELATGITQFEADDYRTPYLRQAAKSGEPALAPVAESIRQAAAAQCSEAIDVMAALVVGSESQARFTSHSDEDEADAVVRRFANSLPRKNGTVHDGYLAVNPHSFSQSIAIATPRLEFPPSDQGSVKAAYEQNGIREVLVQLPPMGYAWIRGDASNGSWQAPPGKSLVEDHTLRSEHFEVQINEQTGGVQSVRSRQSRSNLLSQRLGLRLPQPSHIRADPQYSDMVADSIEISHDGPLTASLTSRGRLVDPAGQLLATFAQTVRVVRDRPILEFDISLDPQELPQGNPWRSYYAARFAYRDADEEVQRSVGLGSHPTHCNRLEAPHFINMASDTLQTTFLTCGLPYHVLVAEGQLDSLLVVPGEPARRFRLAVGIGLTSPVKQSLAMIQPPLVLAQRQADVTPVSSWFFSVDSPAIVATHWEPVRAGGAIVGIRLRLLETSGRRIRFAFRSFRPAAAARKLDFVGNTIDELNPTGERVIIEMVEHEFCTLELEWQS